MKIIGPVISYRTEERVLRGLRLTTLGIMMLFILVPLYWMITTGFKTTEELFATPPTLIPVDPTLDNFVRLGDTIFMTHVWNSIKVAAGTTLLTVLLATLGGYGIARSDFRGRRSLARSILFTYMFPALLIGIPLYVMFYRIGLVNSHVGLVIAQTSVAVPFTTWLMWQYFQTIPLAYEESAWVYGAHRLYTFRKIVLPLALPGIIAISIFAFAISWSNYTLPKILLTDQQVLVFPVGLDQFIQQDSTDWGLLNAAGVVIMIPAFLFVFFMQKYIMTGFRIGR